MLHTTTLRSARGNLKTALQTTNQTRDEDVYRALSRRMKDKFDIFGGLPDTIEDDWIDSEERLEEMMDQYIHLRQKARDVFELRYKETIDPDQNRWEQVWWKRLELYYTIS